MPVLDLDGLKVRYAGFTLGPVTVRLDDGDFLSLIGPNGSGKSTLISAALGLNPSLFAGSVSIMGQPALGRPRELFSHVGYVSDSAKDVLGEFTPNEYWNYCRLAYESARGETIAEWDERVDRYCRLLGFPAGERRPISSLSLGTARKAQIIAALLPDPQVLVLDEPFIGLDFISSRAFEQVLREINQLGTTILASSHDLDLASRVANRILVLHQGQVLLDSQAADLTGGVEVAVTDVLNSARSRKQRS